MSLTALTSNILRLGAQPNLFKANKGCLFLIQSATIKSKALRGKVDKPAPFPYKEKRFTLLTRMFDATSSRFDENTKIIIVDGPVASGKTKFAKALAEDLDMYHIPDADMDLLYIENGFDLRQLDGLVPQGMQTFDEKKFCQNPRHRNAAAFQIWKYRLRYSLYVDALAHVLSTGQGVVIERSPWSDKAFVEAMFKNNFISKEARRGYYEVKRHTIPFILRPHLVIYLDSPIEKVKENIKKRNLPHEQNSPALTDKFLQDMEDTYKSDILAKLSTHAELLMYDWSEEGDVEAIVEDIERLDYGRYTKYDEKSSDWCIANEQVWNDLRKSYADQKDMVMGRFNVPFLDAPELLDSGEDIADYEKVRNKVVNFQYQEGYNPITDSGLLFKTANSKYVKY